MRPRAERRVVCRHRDHGSIWCRICGSPAAHRSPDCAIPAVPQASIACGCLRMLQGALGIHVDIESALLSTKTPSCTGINRRTGGRCTRASRQTVCSQKLYLLLLCADNDGAARGRCGGRASLQLGRLAQHGAPQVGLHGQRHFDRLKGAVRIASWCRAAGCRVRLADDHLRL